MAAQQVGGWAEVETAVRGAVQDWRPGQGETILGRALAALRPLWERHAAELAAAGAREAGLRTWATGVRDWYYTAASGLDCAGAHEAQHFEDWYQAIRADPGAAVEALVSTARYLGHGNDEMLSEVTDLLRSGVAALAAAPAPAGGLLELIEELEEFSRDAGVGAEERGPSLLKELCAAGTVGVAIAHAARRLRECAGLPPREGTGLPPAPEEVIDGEVVG
jgi:hypothetical protein